MNKLSVTIIQNKNKLQSQEEIGMKHKSGTKNQTH